MKINDSRTELIAAATPLFAQQGLNGVSVRQLAKAAGVNISSISYYFNGKEGLYAAVLEEQFSNLKKMADVAKMEITPSEKFRSYLLQCGICFHEGSPEEFAPITPSAYVGVPECPRCLNNDSNSFAELTALKKQAA